MIHTDRLQLTLRTRILLLTGGVLLILLLIISQVLLYQWREAIIARQYESGIAVSRTFAVTVIDALIDEEQSGGAREGVLQTYVDDFMRTLDNVKYVAIRAPGQQTLAAGPAGMASKIPVHLPSDASGVRVRIFNDANFAWVVEVREPLRIAGKSWGAATIGFDATPIVKQLRVLFVLLFVTTLMASCATLIVLYFLATRLTASLSRLVKEIDSVEFERGIAPTFAQRRDDVAFLFDRFDQMKKRIEQSRAQIESARRQIYQAEKLASIGRLASGVAHQVNNPLNGIRSCLYAIKREPENGGQTRRYLELIDEEISNIETVVQKLLGFSRQQSATVSPIDIAASIQKVLNLFELRLKEKNIHISVNLPADLPLVAMDSHLFQEVIMNLLFNSYDAVDPDGKINITAGQHDSDKVFVSVQDDGSGIREEDMERIFEPFFTTKEIGTGTGLGLSVCQSIVERHGGQISVQSCVGEGATFTVVLQTGEADEAAAH